MIVLGAFLKANLARFIILSGNRASHSVVASKVNKLELNKNPTKEEVDTFVMAFKALCTDYHVDTAVINRRVTTGQGAGGAGTFLIEGVLLAVSQVPVTFVHSKTIEATDRKEAFKSNRPDTVDLGKAYDLAYEGLK